jgi:hypothetical protein
MLSDVMERARKTIEVLSRHLITMDVTNEKIFTLYADRENLTQSERRENAIKLLLRCKKMYDARVSVRRIIKMIIRKEREIDVWLHNLDKLTINMETIMLQNNLYG